MLVSIVAFGFHAVFAQQDPLQKKLTLQFTEATPSQVFDSISAQTGINFSYNSKYIDPKSTLTLSFQSEMLGPVLDYVCDKLNLQYQVIKNQVILRPAINVPEIATYTISGFVRDEESGETLPGATVYAENTGSGAISNAYGFYSLTLPEGPHSLTYSFVGFAKQSKVITLTENLKMDMELFFDAALLGEVTIETNEALETIEKSQMSRITVNPKSLNSMPEFAGEIGLIKSMQSLPGIKTHSDGSAFFFVRGGNKDQNLILIDEAPIYNPAHLFGYYSVIIPDVAKSIQIFKGDMPVDKGDRLSSVIDVQTKDGNLRKIGFNGVLNPLIYRFSLEGPIKKDKVSFYTNFRHSNFWWLYRQVAPGSELYLYDLNAKLNWKINPNNRIYFSFFYGQDHFLNDNPGERGGIEWSNFTTTVRWNHVFNSRLFSNATFYTSRYSYALLTGITEWNSGIGNVSLKYDLTWYPHPDVTAKFGAGITGHDVNPGNLKNAEQIEFAPQIAKSQATKTHLYAQVEHNLSPKFSYRFGLRLPAWSLNGPTTLYQFDSSYQVIDTLSYSGPGSIQNYTNLDPRISMTYRMTSSASIKFSYGIYHQYIHLISNSISPFSSFEIWMPSSNNIQPQKAQQVSLGWFKFFEKARLELTLEGYYKKMENQIDYENHANLLLNPLIEGELRFGEADAWGVEFYLRKTKGRFTGWIGYTWSRVEKTIDGVNDGEPFPAYYDRPHDVSLFLSYHLSKRVNVSANWIYYTGSAITTPAGFYSYNGYSVPYYEGRNNERLPDYHRLDLALAWMLNKPGNVFEHTLTFALFNFYNRHNPVSVNFNKIEKPEGAFVVRENLFGTSEILNTQKYLTGIMPSITYRFKL